MIRLSSCNMRFSQLSSSNENVVQTEIMRSYGRRGKVRRIVVFAFLLAYIGILWSNNHYLTKKVRAAGVSLNILYQMRQYAQTFCSGKPIVATDMAVMINKRLIQGAKRRAKRQGITNKTVGDEVTFIVMGPTLKCLNSRVSWLRQRYTTANIFVTIDLSNTFVNKKMMPNGRTMYHFLGGFSKRSDALNRAINLVTTKYFLIIDHFVELTSMMDNYVEELLANMPGFDVLSSAEISADNKLNIPCYHLRLEQWSLLETYEYTTNGNILKCDGTSLFFLGRTEAFRHPDFQDLLDDSLPSKWLEDFFIRFKGILEVGILPALTLHQAMPDASCYYVQPKTTLWLEKRELLQPFAEKYQIFFLSNGTTRENICESNGKLICNEEDIRKKLSIGAFSTTGLTTFPFMIKSLQRSLHFTDFSLKNLNLFYVLEGGTALGLIKMRDILPWDHGDIDTFVYSRRRKVIDMVLKAYSDHGYSYYLRHTGFHTYIDDSGSFIVFLARRVKPNGIIYIRHGDRLFPLKREIFTFLRELYGSLYFEKHMKYTNERNYCKVPGHHACMSDCRWHGCGSG